MEVAVGIYKNDSVFIKLYKKSWANKSEDLLTSESRIFFSVWINKSIINEQKLFYNIHALKLRKLNGYKITSRNFADNFRISFKIFESQWKNVSTQFGPLTLMEGSFDFEPENLQNEIVQLANQFLQIDFLIDDLLEKYKKQ